MSNPPIMSNTPFRFLDLPTELRLEVYKHVANNTYQRRFFSNIPVSFSVTDFSILACCKLIHTEAQDCMRNAHLGRPPTIKIAYDEIDADLLEIQQIDALKTLRKVTTMLILGRISDYSATNTDRVPLGLFWSGWRYMAGYLLKSKQHIGSAIAKESFWSFYRGSILQMRLFPQVIIEVVFAPGTRPSDDNIVTFLSLAVGGNRCINASSCVRVTFMFVVSPEHFETFRPTMPSEHDMHYSAVCKRAIEVRSA